MRVSLNFLVFIQGLKIRAEIPQTSHLVRDDAREVNNTQLVHSVIGRKKRQTNSRCIVVQKDALL